MIQYEKIERAGDDQSKDWIKEVTKTKDPISTKNKTLSLNVIIFKFPSQKKLLNNCQMTTETYTMMKRDIAFFVEKVELSN